MKIGLFDSGLGGLIVLSAVAKRLPQYDYLYYGDTANLPYGDKSEKEIFELTRRGIDWLFKQDCALIIIACNTASAETLRKLQDEYLVENYPNRRILGVIIPTVEELLESKARQGLLIATKRTVDSGKYPLELGKYGDATLKLNSIATPGLVPLIEDEKIDEALAVVKATIDKEMERVGELDTLVLGCTHYAKLKDGLQAVYPKLRILSQDEIIPAKLENYLLRHPELEGQLSQRGTREIKLSLDKDNYVELAEKLLAG